MDEGFDVLDLNSFGGAPGDGPGTNICNEARGRFFVPLLLGFARGINFFGMWAWGFGFGFAFEARWFIYFALSLWFLLPWDHHFFALWLSCQVQGRPNAQEQQKGWSIAGYLGLRGVRCGLGCGRAGFVTTVGSRMTGFRRFNNCQVLRMGFNSMDSLSFCLFSVFTGSRFIIHFIIEPDFGSGFLRVSMCVLSAPALSQRLKHRGHANWWVDIYAHQKEQHLAQWKFFQR